MTAQFGQSESWRGVWTLQHAILEWQNNRNHPTHMKARCVNGKLYNLLPPIRSKFQYASAVAEATAIIISLKESSFQEFLLSQITICDHSCHSSMLSTSIKPYISRFTNHAHLPQVSYRNTSG